MENVVFMSVFETSASLTNIEVGGHWVISSLNLGVAFELGAPTCRAATH